MKPKRHKKTIPAFVIGVGIVALLGTTSDALAVTNAGVLFLRIAAGARAAAMGESFVAVSNDATATHWNPAGLGEYPLNSTWTSVELPEGLSVKKIALVRNDLPGRGQYGYDAWMLSDKGLIRYSNGKWVTHTELTPRAGETLLDALRDQMPAATEDELRDIAKTVSEFNQPVSLAELDETITAIEKLIPESYKDYAEVNGLLSELKDGYLGCSLDLERLKELRDVTNEIATKTDLTEKDHDRVRFLLGRTTAYHPVGTIRLPIGLAVGGNIIDIAADSRRLFIASSDGLFIYDGQNWRAEPAPTSDGWGVEHINCMAVTTGPRVWLGTDSGVKERAGATWKTFRTADGLPSSNVTQIAFRDSRNGWVMTDVGLARFTDSTFSASLIHDVSIGETAEYIMTEFLGTDDQVRIAKAIDQVAAANPALNVSDLQAGDLVHIPYSLGIVGNVQALQYDDFGRIWVGTNFGANRLFRDSWRSFGYRPYTAMTTMSLQEVASSVLGDRADEQRIDRLADHIRRYNRIETATIDSGRTVYVYRNPAGSPINDVLGDGEDVYFATNAGVLRQKSGQWGRYYHGDLERAQTSTMAEVDGDIWFVTNDHMVIFSRAHKEVSLMWSRWLPDLAEDLYYAYAAYVTNVEGWGTIGANLTILSFGEILRTDEFGNEGETFHSFDMAYSMSYGTRVSNNLAAGLTAKVIYSRLSPQGAGIERGSGDATAFAVDMGLLYRTPLSRLSLGAALTNLGPNISYIDADQSDPLPRNLAVGFAYRIADSPYNKFTIVGEINKELVDLTEGGSQELKQIIYNGGFEYVYSRTIALRGGYVYDEDGDIKALTLGAGLAVQGFEFDFAYIPSVNEVPLANTLRISVRKQF